MDKLKIDMLEEKDCLTTLAVEVPAEEVRSASDREFERLQGYVSLPGFRRGKVPLPLVKQNFLEKARENVIHQLLSESLEKAYQKKDLHPVSAPRVEKLSFDFEKPFSFTARIERRPSFKVKDYKKIKLQKKRLEVAEEDTAAALAALQERQAQLVDDLLAQAAGPEHFVAVDYAGFLDGKPLDGARASGQLLSLSDSNLPSGLASGIIGMKVGESREVPVSVAERQARFQVKILAIKKKILPSADDSLAKEVGLASLAELKEKIGQSLSSEKAREQRQDLEKQILEALLLANPLPLPSSLVEERLTHLLSQTQEVLVQSGRYNAEEFEKSLPAMRERYRPEAERNVRASFILNGISREEKIEASPEEVQARIDRMVLHNTRLTGAVGPEAKKIRSYWEKNGEYLSAKIQEEKIFDFLIAHAKIKEG